MPRYDAPKPPPWWRTFWLPVGTIVEYRGIAWRLEVHGGGDTWWRVWVQHTIPSSALLHD